MKIKFIEYNGIEGYIELMKHDIEPLNDSNVKNITLCYDGKDIKAVLDYITNLQERIDKSLKFIDEYCIDDEFYINLTYKEKAILEVKKILEGSDK